MIYGIANSLHKTASDSNSDKASIRAKSKDRSTAASSGEVSGKERLIPEDEGFSYDDLDAEKLDIHDPRDSIF